MCVCMCVCGNGINVRFASNNYYASIECLVVAAAAVL